jgi:hypothetical protein
MSYPVPTIDPPSGDEILEQLEDCVTDEEVVFETSDGCYVEPDGICRHGHPTWLRRYGLI